MGRPRASVTACNLVFMPPFVRPIRRPRPLFCPQAGGRAVCFEIGCVNRDRLVVGRFCSQPHHDPREHPHVAPAFPTVIKRLVRAIFLGCITPTQPIAIDEDNTTQDASVINAWHTMAPRKIGPQPLHLSFAQPIQITHKAPFGSGTVTHADLAVSSRLMGPEPNCSIPDDHISPRRSALFMARSVLRDVRDGVRPC
jgi:hypothetical protein